MLPCWRTALGSVREPGDTVRLLRTCCHTQGIERHSYRLCKSALMSQSPISSPPASRSSSSSTSPPPSRLPTSFGNRPSRKRARHRSPSPQPRPTTTGTNATSAPGAWERHTRGIGSKILAKHGFTGRLGRNRDGLAAPIAVTVRPHGAGLGAISTDRSRAPAEAAPSLRAERNRATAIVHPSSSRSSSPSSPPPIPSSPPPPPSLPSSLDAATMLFAGAHVAHNLAQLRSAASTRLRTAQQKRRAADSQLTAAKAALIRAQASTSIVATRANALREMDIALTVLTSVPPYNLTKLREAVATGVKTSLTLRDVHAEAATILTTTLAAYVARGVRNALKQRFRGAQWENNVNKDGDITDVVALLLSARSALSMDEFLALTARAVVPPVQTALRGVGAVMSIGPIIADVLLDLRDALPPAVMTVIVDDVVLPALAAAAPRVLGDHAWLLPWRRVTGRRALADVATTVRPMLAQALAKWTCDDPPTRTREVAEAVAAWAPVLSRRRLNAALARFVLPKLAHAIRTCACFRMDDGDMSSRKSNVSPAMMALTAWAGVCSRTALAAVVGPALLEGPGRAVRDAAFSKDGWTAGRTMYLAVVEQIPRRVRSALQGTLAALLFVVHAGRCVRDENVRARLSGAEIGVLMENGFGKAAARRQDKAYRAARAGAGAGGDGATAEERKVRLSEMIELIGKREGLVVVGLGDENGMKAYHVGAVKVVADVRRGKLVVNGQVVHVEQLVQMARGG